MKTNTREEQQYLHQVLEMILTTFGMKLPETHYKDVMDFIRERLAARNETISDYINTLSGDREEYIRFVDAVTINESYFFRDSRHFSLLYNEILPELFQVHDHVKLWSAAAAAGEEALSMAVICELLLKDFPGKEYTIYASDINISALNKMRIGRYPKSVLREDGSDFHQFLLPYVTTDGDEIIVDESIRKKVTILEHNLFTENYSELPEHFDLILLRNVFIYMPTEHRNKILFRIVSRLRDNGSLFLSSSEVPLIWHPTLTVTEKKGIYFFRRGSPDEIVTNAEDKLRQWQPTPKNSIATHRGEKQPSIDKETLYDCVNHQIFNPLFEKKQIQENDLAERIVQLIYHINDGDYKNSHTLLTQLQYDLPHNEVVLFYSGVIAKREEEYEKSIRSFQKALDKQRRFWPARYELAMQMKERHPMKAKQQFTLCTKHIQSYIETGKYIYHFLLDGFNALYFLRICEFWEKRLETEKEHPRRIE